jgi:RHS repeat-associated protein
MKTQQRLPLILILFIFAPTLYSQSVITLNTPHTGTHLKVARNAVILNPGFSYTPSSGNTFTAKTDKNIVLDINYLNPYNLPDPSTKQINTSLPVGSIPGSYDVSSGGAASYTIPLFIPKGTNGVQPDISLVYNSMADNGLLGRGWNLSCMSSITRVNKPYYAGGFIRGVNMDQNDSYALDENRLITTYNNSGYDLDTFKTEIETFTKIVSHNSSGNGPSYFDVILSNGTVIKYGSTALSCIKSNDSTVLAWNISKITDISGNYCEFIYAKDNQTGQKYLRKILYTGNTNTNLQPYNEIFFRYERKTDLNEYYYPGSSIPNKLLITRVEAITDGIVIRQYDMVYAYDLSSHLVEITESGLNGFKKNSTIFKWGDASDLYTLKDSPIISPKTNILTSGDFNGDGKIDFISVRAYNYYDSTDVWKLYLNTETGYALADSGYLNRNFKHFVVADPDNDGNDDIFWKSVTPTPNYSISFLFYSLDGDSLKRNNVFDKTFSNPSNDINLVPGDFDGNGECDYVYLYPDNNILGFENISFTYPPPNLYTPDKVYLIDFNGNGKTDILAVYPTSLSVFEYNPSSQDFSTILYNYSVTYGNGLYPGDFNGDGKTDLLLDYYDQNDNFLHFKTFFSTGVGFVIKETPIYEDLQVFSEPPEGWSDFPLQLQAEVSKFGVYVNDLNGDGKSDVLVSKQYTDRTFYPDAYSYTDIDYLKTYTYISNGISFETFSEFDENAEAPYYQQYDSNYDGTPDFLLSYEVGEEKIIEYFPNDQRHLIRSITNGINLLTEFTYLPLTDTSVYSHETQSYTLPVRKAIFPLKVVARAKTFNNNIKEQNNNPLLLSDTKYKYSDLKIHLQGKGGLGFSKFTAENITTHEKAIYQFDFDTTYYISYLAGKKTYLNDNLISESAFNQEVLHEDIYSSEKRLLPVNTLSLSEDKLNNTSVRKTQSLNAAWNLINSTTAFMDQNNSVVKSDSTVFNNYNSRRQPGQTIIYKNRNGETISREKSFEYLSSGLLSTVTDVNDTLPDVTATYLYDSFGNVKFASASVDGKTRSDSTMFESDKGRFVIRKNNPLNHFTQFFYDISGNVIEEKTFSDLTSGYTYDGLGNLLEKRLPDSVVVSYSNTWSVNALGLGDLFYSKVESPGTPTKIEYLDILGRKIRSMVRSFDGTYLISDNSYDSEGRIEKTYLPYFEGSSADQYIDYDYDNYNRKTTETFSPGNITTQYSYDPLKITVTKAGQTSSKESDASGRLIRSTDEGGTIQYSYNAEDQVKQIVSPSGTTLIGYDGYGNQKNLQDIDAGTISYNYNGLGELLSQVDAEGNHITMRYDAYGRLLAKKINSNDSINYTYNSSNGQISSITSVLEGQQVINEFVYDNLQRLSINKEKIDTLWYTSQNTYNSTTGAVDSVCYNSAVRLNYVYNQYGYLDQVKTNNQVIWDAVSMNRYGVVNSFTLGNQASTSIEYDQYGLLDKIITTRSGVYLQNWDYDFDNSTGNLSQRTGLKTNGNLITETFSYDELNRLTSSTIGLNSINISYDVAGKGNITNKSDVGDYGYISSVHKLDSISNPSDFIQSLPPHVIEYTGFTKVKRITQEPDSGQIKELYIIYGPDEQRVKTVYKVGNTVKKTKLFALGSYEKEIDSLGNVRELYYINTGNGIAAVIEKKNNQENIFYVHSDHLGSFDVISKSDGSVQERLNFDPWGRRRNPVDWSYDNVASNLFFDRGFTGHEHLDQFYLINMNGRIFDPVLNIFLSPDNNLQAPDFTQNYNRFAYCFNNPLKYLDPSGYEVYEMVDGTDGDIGFAYWKACLYGYGGSFNDFSDQYWYQERRFRYGGGGGGSGFGGMDVPMTFSWSVQFTFWETVKNTSGMPIRKEEFRGYIDYSISFRVHVGGKGQQASSGEDASYNLFDFIREIGGISLADWGQPKAFKPGGVGGGGKSGKWTSNASKTLRDVDKAIQSRLKTNVKLPWRLMGVNRIGAALGRIVPWVGWSLLAWDVYDNRASIVQFIYDWSNMEWPNGAPNAVKMDDGSIIYVCFLAGTQILTKKGLKPIEEIIVGDSLYSYNLDKNVDELSKVAKSFKRQTQEIYEVITDYQY